ncbi:MAG: LCP family protein [Candidatus Pacebacteria bacterium]|nr:LCP family protein [Candidatus Paceibacterota bacterium]
MAPISKKIFFRAIIIGLAVVLFFLLLTQLQPKEYLFSYNSNENAFIEQSAEAKVPSLNVLFLGIAGEGSRGSLLTDTIFVVHLNPSAKKIAIISIPRDLWVQIPHRSQAIKINGLYDFENNGRAFPQATASNLIKQKIEDITGLTINYTVILELEGFGKLIDAVGGIDIWLEKDISDPLLVNPHNPSEIFHLEAGWRHLDGDLAIKFVRTRYAPEGDFYRIQNQQQIISALKDKLAELTNIWGLTTWLKIWQSLDNHFISDLDFNTLWQIFNLVRGIPADQIEYIKITNRPPDQLLKAVTLIENSLGQNVYTLIPSDGFEQYQKIQNYIKEKIST